MTGPTQVFLFGDQTCNFEAGLRQLVHAKDKQFLISFFETVQHALRTEIGNLSFRQRQLFPRFTTLVDLLARQRKAETNPAIEAALTCVHQFACFIDRFGDGLQPYPRPSETYAIGLCMGLLAAATISSCGSLPELLPAAAQVVLVAFRTGLHTMEVRDRIERPVQTLPVWSVMVSGFEAAAASGALREFSQKKNLPPSSQPYISALALNGLTISGPPSTLEELSRSKSLGTLVKLTIHAPYHASHFYDQADIDGILDTISVHTCAFYQPKIPLISSATGKPIAADNLGSLLRTVLAEILLEPLRLDKIHQGLVSIVQTTETAFLKVNPIATSVTQSLVSALKKSVQADIQIDAGSSGETKQAVATPSGRTAHSKIAIIGLSGRFPEAQNTEAFWDILYQGLDVHKETPSSRWDNKQHVDPTGTRKNTTATPYGCWIRDPGFFDARFFNMSPREAPQVDPAQRLALLTAYEAIEQAGIVPDATPSTYKDRVGVFYGMTSNDWAETNSAQDIDTYFIPGGNRAFTPGRVNYFFKFSGPSYIVDTACSSSLAAIHIACNSLWTGDCDTAIAGGTNVLTNPDFFAGLDRGHFLSRTGNCKTFDDGADGYCRGEGVGTVILKRLEDAIADNDPIQGVILSAYTNHNADAASITRPHLGAQKFLFDKVLNGSNVNPSSVSYIEMHGTGTQTGDAGEMSSVLETFAPASGRGVRTADQPLYLGSSKANIGHGEASSGVSGLAKLLLMLKKNVIPPHCGIKTKINHSFPTDFKERNVHIPLKPTPWNPDEGSKRIAFLNNFSAAGGNSALLLEEAPSTATKDQTDIRSSHLVAVSAKCTVSLKGNLESLLQYLGRNFNQQLSLPALSYTTTARRMHYPHRIMVTGSNIDEIKAGLQNSISRDEGMARPKSAPKIAFAFTGQGSQYPGMGRQFFESYSVFRTDILQFDRIGRSQGFPSILSLIQAETGEIADHPPVVVQLATTCLQMALARLWASWGIVPDVVVGHSLGEYAALNVAGVLSDSDTIFLTGTRAQLLEDQCSRGTHAMLAVKASVSKIANHLDRKKFEVACVNAPEETVLSGTNAEIDEVSETLVASGVKFTKLKVPYAFHSSQVQPILESFESGARGAIFHKPSIPVLCPLLSNVVTEAGTFGPSYLSRHCREAVNILGSLNFARDTKTITDDHIFVEIGPQPVVAGMIRATFGSQTTFLPSLQRTKDPWKVISDSVSSLYKSAADIRWSEYHRDFEACHEVVSLPAYSWELKDYWIKYVHDWTLRKGDPPLIATTPCGSAVTPIPNSTSVQLLLEEKVKGEKASFVFGSDLLRDDFGPIVKGHAVNGVPLCTPSVYAEVALTIGNYLIDRFKPDQKERTVDVSNMTVEKPLIAKRKGPHIMRTAVDVDWTSKKIAVRFVTVNDKGDKSIQHACCTIDYVNGAAQQQGHNRNAYLIKSRMADLRRGLETGQTQKYNRSMAYRIVSSLATYDPEYRGVDEIILDSKTLEATSRVSFQTTKKDGKFCLHPAYIDSLAQTGGFTMNAHDEVDLDKEIHVNHGWRSFQFFEPISSEQVYRTYVRMQPTEEGMYEGDVSIFDEEDVIVAVFRGIVLQGVPRRLMDYILAVKDETNPTVKAGNHQPSAAAIAHTTSGAQAKELDGLNNWNKSVSSKTLTLALAIISEESGVALSELTDDCHFADMGVDSLLSLMVTSRFREEVGVELESSTFMELSTVKGLKDWLVGGSSETTNLPRASTPSGADDILKGMLHDLSDASSSGSSTPFEKVSRTDAEDSDSSVDSGVTTPKMPPATSVILQGLPQKCRKTLFLFPDGCGSSSSYAQIPRVNSDVCVIGLNCPYMKIPEQMACNIDDMVYTYLNEIRRRQPSGPYYFGGWSAGGIMAYNATQKLIEEEGEEVASLILIDSPVPYGLDRLPKRFYDYCNSVGLFGEEGKAAPPGWLVPHFLAIIEVLHEYYATPLALGTAPKTHMIWACNSVMEGRNVPRLPPQADDPEGMKFLLESRTDFGPNGWDTLIRDPERPISIERAEGANHFTMMRGEHAPRLAEFLNRAMM